MRNWLQYKFLHSLLILAFITAGISPACHFIGGQAKASDYIEICTIYGIEKMPVPASEQAPDRPAADLADICQFCFSAYTQKAASDESRSVLIGREKTTRILVDTGMSFPGTLFVSVYDARAPPFLS